MIGIAIGVVLGLVGIGCLAYGLITGAMPPFPSFVGFEVGYRDEDPVKFWINGAAYATLVAVSCYTLATHWTAFLQG